MTPAQYTALKTELTTDPTALGYAPLLTSGDQSGIATLMNTIKPGGAFQVNNEPVSPSQVALEITPADFQAMTSTQQSQLALLFVIPSLDLSDANIFANLSACFPNAGETITNLSVLKKRQGTRGEVLFGNGERITANDISTALES